jgi:transposase-like protein
MKRISYSGYRFPPTIIQRAIWLYLRFTLSLRDVEDLLAERGITVPYESIRRWINHFGPMIAADLRIAAHSQLGGLGICGRKGELPKATCSPVVRWVALT